MKEIMKLGLILFAITAFSAMLLGFAHEITKEPIENQVRLAREKAMNETLSQADRFEEVMVELPKGSKISEINAGYKGDLLEGFVVKVSPKGFGGPIEIMVGVSKDGIVQGIKMLKHSETPGLGANAEDDSFTSQYKDTSGELTVTKTIPNKDNEIQALTGATITSRAITDGVNEVLIFLQHHGGTDEEITFDFN
ncbi:MAG: RnfABCDGE type electron transport complex subunit G [Epulopiscium sp.]|nr:RnfABCDGE type electron transport complex subunit G [Candidatus Epulonipiscium sp.]